MSAQPPKPQGLVMERIRHAFGGTEVLKDVSLVAEPGKLTCLLGPSGCGKTTLLRLAAGLEPIQDGAILIDTTPVADGASGLMTPPERRGVGLMFQDYALFPHLSVFDNIAFGLKTLSDKHEAWIETGLDRMGLLDLADAFPHMLSGGQQQRVALLRAMAPEPHVLLLDEPFSGLDVTRRAQVREDTLEFLREFDVAVVMVTHDPEEAMFMADHIVVMNQGQVVQAGTAMQTYFHPADPFVASLFGPVNTCRSTVTDGRVTTPLGSFPAKTLKDGDRAQVLVRHEGIHVAQDGLKDTPKGFRAAHGKVEAAHPLGRSSHLHIRIQKPDGNTMLLHVRMSGMMLPEVGADVTVWVDEKQTFVFPDT